MTETMILPVAPERGNARSSGYARNDADWYQEPRRAIDALLDVETFEGLIWDPACGAGNIPIACCLRGLRAGGCDIVERPGGPRGTQDFLVDTEPRDNIVTNPPFDLATEFTLHALTHARRKVCILQRTSWLEGERRYQALFSNGHLARVWQFRKRISMPPGGKDIPARNGSVSYAWFVFERSHVGGFVGGWLP